MAFLSKDNMSNLFITKSQNFTYLVKEIQNFYYFAYKSLENLPALIFKHDLFEIVTFQKAYNIKKNSFIIFTHKIQIFYLSFFLNRYYCIILFSYQ